MRNWRYLSGWVFVISAVLIMGRSGGVLAAVPTVYDFRLTQGTAALPSVKIYADIIGAGEVPAKGLQKENLTATIGSTAVKVSTIIPFEDTKEGIGYVLLVDVSKSLSPKQFSMMKETLATFVDAMSERDQAAVVTFGSEVKVIQEFSANRAKIKEKLAVLGPSDEDTAFYGGMDKAISVARAGSAEVPGRRVVITLSDGVNDLTGGISKGDITAKLATDPIPLYIIGYVQGKPTPAEESAIGVMKDFAAMSGGRFYDGRDGGWRGIYFAIARSIRNAFVIEIDAVGFRSEGAAYSLEMVLSAADRVLKSKLQLTIPPGGTAAAPTGTPSKTANQVNDKKFGGELFNGNVGFYAGIALTLIIALVGWIWFRRRHSSDRSHQATGDSAATFLQDGANPTTFTSDAAIDPAPVFSPKNGNAGVSGVLMRLTHIHEGPPPHQIDFEVTDRVVLGSDPTVSHLVFEHDKSISPAHCEISFDSGYLYLLDLGSEQGTFLNGTPLTGRQRVDDQDVLQIGRTEMRITFPT